MVRAFRMDPKIGGLSPLQVETFSVSKTLTLSQEHPFVCRKWMLLHIYIYIYIYMSVFEPGNPALGMKSDQVIVFLVGFHICKYNSCSCFVQFSPFGSHNHPSVVHFHHQFPVSLCGLIILSYLMLSYLMLSDVILSYLISSHLIPSHPIPSYLISSHLILSYVPGSKHNAYTAHFCHLYYSWHWDVWWNPIILTRLIAYSLSNPRRYTAQQKFETLKYVKHWNPN